jgi:hypothetical protein
MSADDYVILEWRYTPTDFFEEPVYCFRDDCEIRIEGGRVTATIDPDYYDPEHKMRDELHEVVAECFRAERVFTHQKYQLSRPSVSRVYPDGTRDVTVLLEGVSVTAIAGNVDVRITSSNGAIVADTRRERLEQKRAWREACGRLSHDEVLRRMLASYGAAVDDPNDEMVHLYEIRDALSSNFNGDDRARKSLGIPKKRWGRFGELACAEPLRQSRHRGEHSELRDATAEELREAREIARGLIEAYVRWANAKSDREDG